VFHTKSLLVPTALVFCGFLSAAKADDDTQCDTVASLGSCRLRIGVQGVQPHNASTIAQLGDG
jgi:hypothetical protein